jgi:aspartate 4-decarboxylase
MTDAELCLYEQQVSLGAAARRSGRPVLDAGRGQPNWVATLPRAGMLELDAFALDAATASGTPDGRGRAPAATGLADRLAASLATRRTDGAAFLAEAVAYGVDELGFDPDPWVDELVRGTLGAGYPTPTPALAHVEAVLERYLTRLVGCEAAPRGTYQLFATEGGAAAMAYVFNTLRESRLIQPGDAIALATPIFTPYLQIPVLEDFGFRVVEIPARHDAPGRFAEHALDRLADPSIKAFFLINPGNPDSRAIGHDQLRELHDLVVRRRPDLLIIADTAYAAFLPDFHGALADVPRNVVCIHSFSKTFGATGNRLGFIAVHRDNVLDEALGRQAGDDLDAVARRYGSVTADVRSLSFVRRLVADSRDVALHNIAGLGTPGQVQMALFALAHLLPSGRAYIDAVRKELVARQDALFEPLGIAPPGGDDTGYYALIDLLAVVRARQGDAAAERVSVTTDPWTLATGLAAGHGVIVLPGQLFDADSWDVRVSAASLDVDELRAVGRALAAVLDDAAR